MNEILENTRECMFRGVPFPVTSIVTTGGATMSEYLLANSDRRIMKYGGKFPPEFVLTGALYSTDMNWQEYIGRVNAFRSVIEVGLSGKFTHPIYGDSFCSCSKYTLNDDFAEVGKVKFSVTFKQVSNKRNPLTPTGTLFSVPQVKAMALNANRKLQSASANAMTHDNALNKKNTKNFFEKISDKMAGKFSAIGENIQKATDFTGKVFDAKDKASFYADNPSLLFAAIADNLLGIDGLTADVFVKMSKIRDMFLFGDDDDTDPAFDAPIRIPDVPTIPDEAERTNNANVMRTFVQAGSVIEYSGYAADMQAAITADIDEAIEVLSENAQRIIARLREETNNENENFLSKPDYSETIQAIEELTVTVDSMLRQKKESAPYVMSINVQPMPVEVLAYLLYRDSTRAFEIMELNGATDPMRISGEVLVLSK